MSSIKNNRDLRERFEANMLDGEKIEESGNAMLSAVDVWAFLKEAVKDVRISEVNGIRERAGYDITDTYRLTGYSITQRVREIEREGEEKSHA